MTTQAQLEAWRADLDAARYRAERAQAQGDHAGALIAGGDARLILSRLRAAFTANVNERQSAAR